MAAWGNDRMAVHVYKSFRFIQWAHSTVQAVIMRWTLLWWNEELFVVHIQPHMARSVRCRE